MRDPFDALVDRPPGSPQAGPAVAAPAVSSSGGGGAAGGTDGAGGTGSSQQQRRRVPIPHDAALELRAMLARSRYPDPEAREALARRHGLDRKRVDRWLENARARSSTRGANAPAAT